MAPGILTLSSSDDWVFGFEMGSFRKRFLARSFILSEGYRDDGEEEEEEMSFEANMVLDWLVSESLSFSMFGFSEDTSRDFRGFF